jgi:TPR repeat protein
MRKFFMSLFPTPSLPSRVRGPARALKDADAAYQAGEYEEALRWYQLAVEQGNAEGQVNLGYMYAIGQGVEQDNVLAHMLFALAAAQGNTIAVGNLATAASKMTPAEIAEAHKLAREWLATHPQ